MTVESYDAIPDQIDSERLEFLAGVATYFDDNVTNIVELLGDSIPLPDFPKSAASRWVDAQRGMYYYYDLRLASSVFDLKIRGFGEALGDYVDYELSDNDAFVLFTRDGLGERVSRHTVVIDFDGNIPFSKEFYHGPMVSNGIIGDGDSVRPKNSHTARAIIRNMMANALPLADSNILASPDPGVSSFGLEMAYHTMSDA